jgi:hypothetical protein
MFFAPAKIIENNLKGVKMSQNRSKPWAIVHAFWPKMIQDGCFLHQKTAEITFHLFFCNSPPLFATLSPSHQTFLGVMHRYLEMLCRKTIFRDTCV